MKNKGYLFTLLVIIILLSACSTISYAPKLTLDLSPVTIDKSLRVDKLVDTSPSSDHKTPFLGLAVTTEEAMSGKLDLEVTNAIANDFATNGLFAKAGRKMDDADYVLSGEIRRYMGMSKTNNYAKISLLTALTGELIFLSSPGNTTATIFLASAAPLLISYFGLPVRYNAVAVELAITISNKNGQVVGAYKAAYIERKEMNMYQNRSLAIVTMTNKAFSNVVADIRNQIIADQQKYQ